MHTVSVLLSTYNGHKYLNELVDSVLQQEGVEVSLQVRDDGSTDDTLRILEDYHDSRIHIVKGKNVGPADSFLTLLRQCDDADFYAYCDQDDIWYREKLATATTALEGAEGPALFISTYDVVSEDLAKLFTYDMHYEVPLRLQDTLIYRAPSACNMVLNHKLRELINKSRPTSARMHDFWTLLVAESNQCKIITNDTPLIMYRQHSNNTVSITPSVSDRFRRLAHSFFKGDNERWRQAKDLYDAYGNEMSPEIKDIVKRIVSYRLSVANRVALLRDHEFVTNSRYINILFKASVLLGKF